MKFSPLALPLTAAALVMAGTLGTAQIERLDLAQMVAKADNAVIGTITGSEVIRIDHPTDGPELYFTTLTIQGQALHNGEDVTVDVTFAGGFVDADHGVNNSEAPSADDTRVGNKIVAFYAWVGDMGGGLAANALYAAHGGLYRTFEARQGTIVQGRGEGYALVENVKVTDLKQQVAALKKQ